MTSILQRHIKRDPKENDPKYSQIIEKAGIEAEKIVDKECPDASLGRCHLVWYEQKRILKEEHGIDWKTPREMNPLTRFD